MKRKPFISVIIPVYNDPERLKMCLQSLESQTYPQEYYEIIVVDNGSDESIEPLVEQFPQVKSYKETSLRGPSVARNKGLSFARGTIIAFTDADCIPANDWLEQGRAALQTNSRCGLVGGRIEMFFRDPAHPNMFELYDTAMFFNQKMFIEQLHFGATANVFTYKHIFDRVGNFDTALGMSDDMEWGQRVASFGYILLYADNARVAHPAMHAYGRLRQKVRRVTNGTAKVYQKTNGPFSPLLNRNFFIGLLPPIRTIVRLEREYTLTTQEKYEFLRIWFFLKFIDIKENFRVVLGGRISQRGTHGLL